VAATGVRGDILKGRRLALVIGCIVLALVIRLVFAADRLDTPPQLDAADYDRHALSIAAGEGYPQTKLVSGGGPTAFRAPLYPYFLGAVYAGTGTSGESGRWAAARLVQVVPSLATAVLVGLLAWQLWGAGVGMTALALASVYPPFVVFGQALLSESLFLPLELAAVIAAVRIRRSTHAHRWALAAGALCGLASLTRVTGVVLLVVLAGAAWSAGQGNRRRLTLVALVLGVAAAVVTPWTVRNAIATGAFVPLTTQAGFTLAGTYNDEARLDKDPPAAWRPYVREYQPILRNPSLDEVEAERELRSATFRYAREHPSYVPRVVFWNATRLLNLRGPRSEDPVAGENSISRELSALTVGSFYLVAVLGLLGVATGAGRRAPLFIWAYPLLALLSVAITVADMRLRMPAEPFLVLLAAAGLYGVTGRLRRSDAAS
jgi:4-amino-4-deoxy-L-arabinose transferase-like glycosyltransferase